MLKPLLIAFQLMTRLPTPKVSDASSHDYGRSVLFYPLVGLVIGGFLYGLCAWFEIFQLQDRNLLTAALLLALWVTLSGALHLDGLADSADAWLGGFGDRKRTLEIMKDPYAGPAAVVVVVLLLLIKFSALSYLVNSQALALMFIPVLARSGVMMLFLTTRYVRDKGIASAHMAGLPRKTCWLVILITWALMLYILGIAAIAHLLLMLVFFVLLRYLMIKRIGGMTGDTAGAMIEILETALLAGFALIQI